MLYKSGFGLETCQRMSPDYMFVAGEMEQKLLCIFFLDTLYHFFLPIKMFLFIPENLQDGCEWLR